MAEERRLLHVGTTRARRHLELLAPQRFFVSDQARPGDRHVDASLSRFITDRAAVHFERVCPPPPAGAQAMSGGEPVAAVAIELAARLRERWTR